MSTRSKYNKLKIKLINAVTHDNFDEVKKIINDNPFLKDSIHTIKTKDTNETLLEIASRRGRVNIVKFLLKKGYFSDLKEPIVKAIKHNRPNVTRILIKNIIDDTNEENRQYRINHMLYRLINHSDLRKTYNIIKTLINAGANPNEGSGFAEPLLIILIKRYDGDWEHSLFHVLNIDGDGGAIYPTEAQMTRVQKMNHEKLQKTINIMKLLIQKGADVNYRGCEVIDEYDYGYEINFSDYTKCVIDYALKYGKTPLLKVLLMNNANPDNPDENGNTPLMDEAGRYSDSENIDLLLEYYANINLKNKNNKTALSIAMENMEFVHFLKILLRANDITYNYIQHELNLEEIVQRCKNNAIEFYRDDNKACELMIYIIESGKYLDKNLLNGVLDAMNAVEWTGDFEISGNGLVNKIVRMLEGRETNISFNQFGKHKGRKIHTGKRGGRYYKSRGRKVYL
jgi:ankyrin repeat protein